MLPAGISGDPAKRTPADNMTVRNVFIVDPNKKIRLILVYPMATGRNFQEILRVIDSMQLSDKHKIATPSDWKQGDDVIITAAVNDEQAKTLFPGFKTLKPYLRTTAQPR
jgi:alkyl hydroperoxide reductase subunit AhpC